MRYFYLHGFASNPDTSAKAAWMKEKFGNKGLTLEAPQLVPGDFFDLTITGMLEVLDEIIGSDEASIIGSSLGGLVASHFASSHPNVKKLVLLCPAFGFPRRWAEQLGPDEISRWKETGSKTVFHYAENREREVSYRFYEDGLSFPEEPSFSQPAAIIHGTADSTVPIAYSRNYAESRPHITLKEKDDDHSLGTPDSLQSIWETVQEQFEI